MAKSYKKFLATAATTAIVVSAVVPAAMAAGFIDVTSKYKEAVDFVVSKGANGISETEFGIHENIKRVDAAVLLVNVLGLDIENAKPSGFTDVPARAVKHVNALKEAGITSGKTETTFGSHSLITRGELAVWIQKGFELAGKNEVPFTDVSNKYKKAVSALVDHGITHGVSKTEFGTTQHAKRGDYAIFLKRAAEASSKVEYKVEGVKPQLYVKDDESTADVNETTMNFFVMAVKLSGTTEIIKNPTVLVKDKDGNTVEGKAAVNASTGEVTITATLEDVEKGPFTLEVKAGDRTVLSTTYTVTDNRQGPAYEVKSSQILLTNTDENVLNTLFDGTVLDFGSTEVTVTDVDFTTDDETIIADNDAVKEGTVAVSNKYNGNTAIYVDTVTVNVDDTNETYVLDLNDLKVDVSLQATHGSQYVSIGIDKTDVLDYISINMNFQNSFDKNVTGLEVSLLDADGEVVITNKANLYGLLRYVQPAVKNNGGLTTTFWADPNQKLGSWDTTRHGNLEDAVEVQVTFTADGASYTTSEVYRQAPEYTVNSTEAVLTNTDENVLNTVFDGTILDFGSTEVTVTDVDFTSANEDLIADNDAVKEGTVAVNTKYNGKTSINVDTVTISIDNKKESYVLDLNDLQVDVSLQAHGPQYVSLGVDKTHVLDYISINMNFQNSFDKKVTGLEVSLLDADGEVVITNKANLYGLLRYVQPAVKNNGGLTTTFWADPNQKLGSWDTTRYGSLEDAVKAQVTFTTDDASYVSGIDFE